MRMLNCLAKKNIHPHPGSTRSVNPLSAGISLFFDLFWSLEGRVLHKGAWFATLLGTLLGVQEYKKLKFPCTV